MRAKRATRCAWCHLFGDPTRTLLGVLPVPRRPPSELRPSTRFMAVLWVRVATFRRSYPDQRRLRSPLDTIAQGHFVAPCTLDHGLSRPWTHDRCSAPASTNGRLPLSHWMPIDQGLVAPRGPGDRCFAAGYDQVRLRSPLDPIDQLNAAGPARNARGSACTLQPMVTP